MITTPREVFMFTKKNQIILTLFLMLIVGFISLYLGKDNNYDLLNYHHYSGYVFFNLPVLHDFFAGNFYSYFNPLIDALNYWIMTFLPSRFAGFLLGALQSINFLLVILIASNFIYSETKLNKIIILSLIAITSLFSANVIGEIGTTHNDLTLAIFPLLGLLFFAEAFKKTKTNSRLLTILIGGLLFGCGAGFKLTLSCYAVGAGLAFLLLKEPLKIKLLTALSYSIGVLVGFLLIDGYWMMVLWQNFGNPLFPFYNHIFKSPFYYPVPYVIPSRGLNAVETIFYPFYFSWDNPGRSGRFIQSVFRDFRLPCVYVLTIIYAYSRLVTRKEWTIPRSQVNYQRFFIFFFILSYIIWQFQFSVIRYLMVLDLLAPVVIYITLSNIYTNKKVIFSLFFLIVIFLLATLKPAYWGRLPWGPPWGPEYFKNSVTEIPKEILSQPSIVIVTSERKVVPMSYARTDFPQNWRFIGVNDLAPDASTLVVKFLKKIPDISQFKWYMMLDIPPKKEFFEEFGEQVDKPCYRVRTFPQTFYLCPLQPTKLMQKLNI